MKHNTVYVQENNTLYFIILEFMPLYALVSMYALVSEVHVCIKATLKGELSSSPGSSVGKRSGCKSQVSDFESHFGQELFIFESYRFQCAPGKSTEPIQMKFNMTFIQGRENVHLKEEMVLVLVPTTR